MLNLSAADTRVFLFHSPSASADPKAAMDSVNHWLSRDRSTGQYPNLKIADIGVTPDGAGGVYTLVVCSLGEPRKDPV
ncbi:MAG: hypothetical protein AB7V46_22305 [Thermomicrobiales bacterium]